MSSGAEGITQQQRAAQFLSVSAVKAAIKLIDAFRRLIGVSALLRSLLLFRKLGPRHGADRHKIETHFGDAS